MADLDLARIKRNVAKMASMNAPEADIDGYIASEGVTVDAIRDFRPGASTPGPQATPTQRFADSGVPLGGDGATMQASAPDRSGEAGLGSRYGGVGMNATAGLNEGLYGIAGAPVDLVAGAMNLGIRGVNAATGSELPTINEPFGGSRSIARGMGAIAPQLDPANTVAKSPVDRVARGSAQGLSGTVVPAAALAAAGRAAMIGPEAASLAERLVGRAGSVGDAALGAAAGAGAAVGQEIAPEGYEPLGALAGGMAGGTAGMGAAAAGRGARALVEPFTPGGREAMAGRRLAEGASDVDALRRSLDNPPAELVPGSRPTTFQQTGDLGIGVMEKNAANRAPDRFAERRGEQNAARVNAMRDIEPGGAPEKVASAVRQHLDAIEAESERLIGAATDAARTRTAAIGAPMTPEAAGGDMRGALEAARAQAKANERALWDAVDPDGRMTLGLGNTRRNAQGIAKELSPLAQPLSATESQIYGAIGQAGETVPLRAMQDLQSNLKTAMRQERMTNGESPAYRRMSIVSAGIAKDFDDAVAGRVAQEAQAVQSGQMRAEDTVEARWAREVEAWRGQRQAVAGGDSNSSSR